MRSTAPIPADFSSATFFLCAGALIGDEVTLLGLDFSDSQPDKAVVDYLKAMGADITVNPDSIAIRASELRGTEIDMNATPDALPAMSVTAAFAKGQTRFVNVPQARTKETDRIACMAKELAKMNVDVEELPDGLVINGGKPKSTQCTRLGRPSYRYGTFTRRHDARWTTHSRYRRSDEYHFPEFCRAYEKSWCRY